MSRTDGAASWKQVEDLFYSVLALDPAERPEFLERNCGDDPGLRAEVESLIAFSGQTLESLRAPVEWAAQSVARREAGQQMGPYRLLRLLGDGGMGQVYLAERSDQLYELQVAIKLMHSGLKQTSAML